MLLWNCYTSTIAIAAILWIGNSITSFAGLYRIMAIASLVFLVVSLVIAVFTVKRVLNAWASEWILAREDCTVLMLKKFNAIEPSKASKQIEIEHINRLMKAIDDTKTFSQPTGFNAYISWHISILLAGLFIYVLALVLGTL